jgi:UMF1 family MFS transporter
MTAGIALAGKGQWLAGICLYVAANIGYTLANLFYDSLLVDVAENTEYDMVSSWGFGLGYIGSSFLFVLNMAMYAHPDHFGFHSSATAIRVSFVLVAAWWLLFSFPILAFVKQRGAAQRTGSAFALMTLSVARLRETVARLARSRNLVLFLIAYWVYIDGINTVIVVATDFGLSLGFKLSFLMVALLVVQLVAFPASVGFGFLARHIGAKRSIIIGLGVYLFIAVGGAWFTHGERDFIVLACLIGAVQGGVQALSRSLFAGMVPPEAAADFFGVYNLVGKFAVIGGPAAVGATNLVLHAMHQPAETATRAGISVLAILFLFGGALLLAVKQPVREK